HRARAPGTRIEMPGMVGTLRSRAVRGPARPSDGDRMRPPLVLTIAGSEADGAAGVQADLKTFTALGSYGASALTMVVSVNPQGVRGVHPLPPEVVRSQIDAVADE